MEFALSSQPMSDRHTAAIVGWGKCLPPAVLSNADLATFLETTDEWILTRTGIRERRVSHVPLGEIELRRGRHGRWPAPACRARNSS